MGTMKMGRQRAEHNVHRKLIYREIKLKQEKNTKTVIIK